MSYKFSNDYCACIHPAVLEDLVKYSQEQNVGYGLDKHSINAENLILSRFNLTNNGKVFFVTGGTQANLLVISYLLKPYEAVIAADTGHINVHETGAVEGSGHKILVAPNKDGKLQAKDVEKIVLNCRDEHVVYPKMVYISNSTESGTIYFKEELIQLREVCNKYNLYLFMDGARLGSALTAQCNDITEQDISSLVDVFYVGGTKNGLLSGEAIVFADKELCTNFRYHIKNKGAMLAKGFVLGIQFETMFKSNLYFDIAKEVNLLAEYTRKSLNNLIEIVGTSPTNQIFIKTDKQFGDQLIEKFGLEMWEELDNAYVLRIVISFITKHENVDELIAFLKNR